MERNKYNLSLKFLILLCLYFQASPAAFAIEGVYRVVIEKQKEKQSTRWSLVDWLSTKKRIALMDQWLALNTKKTVLEGFVGYSTVDLDRTNLNGQKSAFDGSQVDASLFIFMLGFDYSKAWIDLNEREKYGINLLVLGSSLQTTNLRVGYGQQTANFQGVGKVEQGIWGPHLDLYLFDFLGVSGSYQKLLKDNVKGQAGQESEGEVVTLGAFLELGPIRLEARQRKTNASFFNGASLTNRYKDEETHFGLKLFF